VDQSHEGLQTLAGVETGFQQRFELRSTVLYCTRSVPLRLGQPPHLRLGGGNPGRYIVYPLSANTDIYHPRGRLPAFATVPQALPALNMMTCLSTGFGEPSVHHVCSSELIKHTSCYRFTNSPEIVPNLSRSVVQGVPLMIGFSLPRSSREPCSPSPCAKPCQVDVPYSETSDC